MSHHKQKCDKFQLIHKNKEACNNALDIIDGDKKHELQERLDLPAYVDWSTVVMKKPPQKYETLLNFLLAKVNKEKNHRMDMLHPSSNAIN